MTHESIAKILLFNENDQILLLRLGIHKLWPEKSHTSDLPGGIVDLGESEKEAVIRETKEEADITLDPEKVTLGHAATRYYPAENKSVTRLLYIVKLDATPPVTLSWEHEAYEWCDIDVLTGEHGLTASYKEAVLYLKNNQLI